MFLLRSCPAAEYVVDGEQLHRGEGSLVLSGDLRIARAIGVAGRDFLSFPGVPVFQVSLRRGARALLVGNRVNQGDRRLGENRARWRHNLEPVLSELAPCEIR